MTVQTGDSSPAQAAAKAPFWRRALSREAPYVAMLVMGLIGIGYTDLSPLRSSWYWQALAVVFAILCIATQWSSDNTKRLGRLRLVWTQVLHWGAFLIAMRLAFLPVVSQNMSSETSGLVMLYTLALSTFLAGIYLNWRLLLVGVFLAAGMVAVAYLDQATVLMSLVGIVVVVTFLLWDSLPFVRRKAQS